MNVNFTGRETLLIDSKEIAAGIQRHDYFNQGEIIKAEAKKVAKKAKTQNPGEEYISPYAPIKRETIAEADLSESYALSHGNAVEESKPKVDIYV